MQNRLEHFKAPVDATPVAVFAIELLCAAALGGLLAALVEWRPF